MMTDGRVVQHAVSGYDVTDDPDTHMSSAKLPKFSLEPKHRKGKLARTNPFSKHTNVQ